MLFSRGPLGGEGYYRSAGLLMAQPGDLIGSRISLISNKDLRYEGILFNINAEESSVTLQNVRCYGREGRGGPGAQEWKPDDKMYDYVMFSAADIKDLHVHDGPKKDDALPPQTGAAAPPPQAPGPPPGPAPPRPPSVVPRTQPPPPPSGPQQQQQQQQRPAQQRQHQQGGGGGGQTAGQPTGRTANGSSVNKGFPQRRPGSGALPGSGTHLLGRRGKVEGSTATGPDGGDGEFDFEEAGARFNKEEELAKLSLGTNSGQQDAGGSSNAEVPAIEVKKYTKSSFFDELTTGHAGEARISQVTERKVNMDTFGMAALHNPRRRGGAYYRGGGRGRGGGGGARGGRGAPTYHRGRGGGGRFPNHQQIKPRAQGASA